MEWKKTEWMSSKTLLSRATPESVDSGERGESGESGGSLESLASRESRASTLGGRERRKEFEFTYIKPSERDALRRTERERVDKLRRQRKQVRIESEPKGVAPAPAETGTGAP